MYAECAGKIKFNGLFDVLCHKIRFPLSLNLSAFYAFSTLNIPEFIEKTQRPKVPLIYRKTSPVRAARVRQPRVSEA
jgi:hypothetical protein